MKLVLTPANVAFNAAAKTLTFSTEVPATISHILHVTNITRGVLYFQPQDPAYLGSYASPVLTLACSTTDHQDGDKLLVVYDDGVLAASEVTLSTISGKLPASLGIKTAANSLSVAPASDATFPASQSGAWNIGNISGTISLPTGAATEATLSAMDGRLATIDTSAGYLPTVEARVSNIETDVDAIATNVGALAAYSDQFGFKIPNYDYKAFSYSGDNISTIIYKTGGAAGSLVATLTFAYSGSNITSITQS